MRFLPGGLLPGPLAFAAATDCFLTATSAWVLESYKYQKLAVAAPSESREVGVSGSRASSPTVKIYIQYIFNIRHCLQEAGRAWSGKRVTADWSVSLGEAALALRVFETSPAPASILVLGERSLLCFSQAGMLRYINRYRRPSERAWA